MEVKEMAWKSWGLIAAMAVPFVLADSQLWAAAKGIPAQAFTEKETEVQREKVWLKVHKPVAGELALDLKSLYSQT